MAKRPTLTDVTSILNAGPVINNNWDEIETAFDNTLSRDGSTPNQMEADFDLNSNDLLNGGNAAFGSLTVNGINILGTIQAGEKHQYASRSDLVNAISTGPTIPDGTLLSDGSRLYVASSGATSISDLLGLLPYGTLTPQHFGAVMDYDEGTGLGTDDFSAWSEMITYMVANKVRTFFVEGQSLVSAPLIFSQFGVRVIGSGVSGAGIFGSHTTGPVVQFRKSYARITGLKIGANTTRAAASYGILNAGILTGDFDWTNPAGDVGASGAWIIVEQCTVQDHPGPAHLRLGSGGRDSHCNYSNNKGGAFHVDPGPAIGVTAPDLGFPGWSVVEYCKMENNGGHKIVIGSPSSNASDTIYRYEIVNNDGAGNATDAAVRYSDHDWYIVGENIETRLNAVGSKGMYVAGRNQRHRLNRFPGVTTTTPIFVDNLAGYGTDGIVIEECDVNSPSAGASNPLVTLAASLTLNNHVSVKQGSKINITTLVSASDRLKLVEYQFGTVTDYNGELYENGVRIGPLVDETSWTPTFRFSGTTDLSIVYDGTTEAYYVRRGDMVFYSVRLVFTPTFTTGGIALIEGWPLTLETAGYINDAMPITDTNNIGFGGGVQLAVRVNTGTSARIVSSVSGGAPVSLDITHFTSGVQHTLNASGWVRVG